jgi:hypothetical protein
MLQKDKVVLRNVVIAVVAGSLGAVVIGTSCLGRHPLAVPTEQTTATTTPGTTADNAGGLQAEPVSTTNITSTTIMVNPATQPSTSQPEPNQTPAPAPATTTVITQAPASPPTVRIAAPVSAPPAPVETAAVEETPPPPPAEEMADAAAAAPVAPAPPILVPVPLPETPSSGNVPSNPGIGSPQQPTPGTGAAPGLGQTRMPQPTLPVAPGQPQP